MLGLISMPKSSCSLICECVVLAGWITSDLTSATLASIEKILSRSVKVLASEALPLISKVNMDPAPLGKYFIKRVVGVVRQRRMVDLLNLGMTV